MSEPCENDLRLFDRVNAAVVPHPQTQCIRRPGKQTNIAPRPAAPWILPKEFKGGREPEPNGPWKPSERFLRATRELDLERGQRSSSEIEFLLDLGPGPPRLSFQPSKML